MVPKGERGHGALFYHSDFFKPGLYIHFFISISASLVRHVCECVHFMYVYTWLCIHAHVVRDAFTFFSKFSGGFKQNPRRLRTEKWAKEHTLSEEFLLFI